MEIVENTCLLVGWLPLESISCMSVDRTSLGGGSQNKNMREFLKGLEFYFFDTVKIYLFFFH